MFNKNPGQKALQDAMARQQQQEAERQRQAAERQRQMGAVWSMEQANKQRKEAQRSPQFSTTSTVRRQPYQQRPTSTSRPVNRVNDRFPTVETQSAGHKILAVLTFLILGVMFACIAASMAGASDSAFYLPFAIGLVVDFFIARRIWRGY